jgi:hypothetical protein
MWDFFILPFVYFESIKYPQFQNVTNK